MSSVHSSEYEALLRALRQARGRAGLTQARVAELLRRPQSFVSKCESGERRIDVIELRSFLDLYDVNLATFMKGIPRQRRRRART